MCQTCYRVRADAGGLCGVASVGSVWGMVRGQLEQWRASGVMRAGFADSVVSFAQVLREGG